MSFSMQINRGLFALSLLGFFAVLGNTVDNADAATPVRIAGNVATHANPPVNITTAAGEGICTTSVVRLRLASAPGDLHHRTLRFATACRA